MIHNHPSGDPEPSRQDVALTRELIAAAKPLGITIHDHIVVGAQGQTSLRSRGLI
ncbi:JAB domain-containing protein [Rhizorhabdus dicambivorans]